MYFKDIESKRADKQVHDSNQKKASAERLAKNSAWNKAHKKSKD